MHARTSSRGMSIQRRGSWAWERGLADHYFSNEDRSTLGPLALRERAQIVERAKQPPAAIRWHRANQVVGAGPSGMVYQALCDTTGELLACKEIKSVGLPRESVDAMLQREVLSLSHPNLIAYRLAEWRGDTLCLLMEFGDGGCVASVLASYGALPWKVSAGTRLQGDKTVRFCLRRRVNAWDYLARTHPMLIEDNPAVPVDLGACRGN
mmetsp:Transcript_74039/g.197362  ORF Transcript_74039/g.197362 Transcript_74039/m.197362 type:complete len:209 (-) Transcript_74039:783-1409(-)